MELSKHPEVEQNCRTELLKVLGPEGDYSFENFKDLKYTNAVFLETLRLHANVPGMCT